MISLFDFTQLTQFSFPFISEQKAFQGKAEFWGQTGNTESPWRSAYPPGALPRSFQRGEAAPLLNGVAYYIWLAIKTDIRSGEGSET